MLLQCLVRRFLRKALCVFFGRRYEKANCVVHTCSVKKLGVEGRVSPPLSCCNIRQGSRSINVLEIAGILHGSKPTSPRRTPTVPPALGSSLAVTALSRKSCRTGSRICLQSACNFQNVFFVCLLVNLCAHKHSLSLPLLISCAKICACKCEKLSCVLTGTLVG